MITNKEKDLSTQLAIDEAQLIEQCQQQVVGWQAELASWITQDSDWLYRLCFVRLDNQYDAEDAAQEITMKVIGAIGGFQEKSALRTWVTRIANNHCNGVLKRRNSTAIADHIQHSIVALESERYSQDENLLDELGADVSVQTVLNGLSEKNQEILRLRFESELSLDELASLLNLSLSASKMRLYRAMDAFKKKYVINCFV